MLKKLNFTGRLSLSFGVVIALLILVSTIAISRIHQISTDVSQVAGERLQKVVLAHRLADEMGYVLRSNTDFVFAVQDSDRVSALKSFDEHQKILQMTLDSIQPLVKSDTGKAFLSQVIDASASLTKEIKEIQDLAVKSKDPKKMDVVALLNDKYKTHVDQFMKSTNGLCDHQMQKVMDSAKGSSDHAKQTVVIIWAIGAVALVLTILLAWLIGRSIRKPLEYCVEIANQVALGNTQVHIQNHSEDETGRLLNSMSLMVQTINRLVDELNQMSHQHDLGMIDATVDPDHYEGSFKKLVTGINLMVAGHISVKRKTVACFAEFSKGNFEAELERFPGQKAFINETVEVFRAKLKDLIADISTLVTGAVNGDLKVRVDASRYDGDYRKIVQGINETLDTVLIPITEISTNLARVAHGDLTSYIHAEFKGDHATLKSALNNTLDSLNEILGQVDASARQVQMGSGELSSSSQTVSQGSTESAASIEEISASMTELATQTRQNAENASLANQLATSACSTAETGNKQMDNMVQAMTEIEGASRNISKIIKVIDEIAFQTNLLALNAAVEAARAGVHGKGFAVVAEEVRNLAARSAKAARETTEMIENTITKVSNGSSIAQDTQKYLKEIVVSANRVSDLVSEINIASNEQSQGLMQVNQGISQLDAVTQQNSAASEQAAASSEELSGQANLLIDAIGRFKLKNQSQIAFVSHKSSSRPQLSASTHSDQMESKFQHSVPSPSPKALKPSDIIDLDDPDFGKF